MYVTKVELLRTLRALELLTRQDCERTQDSKNMQICQNYHAKVIDGLYSFFPIESDEQRTAVLETIREGVGRFYRKRLFYEIGEQLYSRIVREIREYVGWNFTLPRVA